MSARIFLVVAFSRRELWFASFGLQREHNSGMRRIRFVDWLAGAKEGRARAARIERAFVEPYRRERPRDPEKARLLREGGTPERLTGPEK